MTATAEIDSGVPVSLSAAMRAGSAAEHRAAEDSPFVTELLAGRLRPAAYADLLLRLRRVYAALEAAVSATAADPFVAAVHDPVLDRVAAIDADLAHWAPGSDPAVVVSPATDAYCARLDAARSWGGLLVAHHYTRYLGDLSGGQAIARALVRTYGPDASAGVSFFDFAIAKPKLWKDAYRARLDALAPADEDAERLVEEVRTAFRLNRAVFAELGAALPGYRV
ncbi:biliverdin-producing heme oxygenase [Jatrophihabitans fulvus]